MVTVIPKYLQLICIFFILFGINISKVVASDCDVIKNILPYVDDESFKSEFERNSNCCDVKGIGCDSQKQNIASVSLKKKHVTDFKSVVEELKNLKYLYKLNLSKSNLTGSLPVELKYLKNLSYLNLSENDLEGYIPYELSELKNLGELRLNNNVNLKGYIPPFTGVKSCTYYKTSLCSLTGGGCHADIQCYKEEIIDTNKHNGNSDPNANVDRAITNESERTYMVGDPGIDDDDDDDIDNYDLNKIIKDKNDNDSNDNNEKGGSNVFKKILTTIITILIIIIVTIVCWRYREYLGPILVAIAHFLCCLFFCVKYCENDIALDMMA